MYKKAKVLQTTVRMYAMYVEIATAIACTLSLISASRAAPTGENCVNSQCIFINDSTGYDSLSCLLQSSASPCKTLSFVFDTLNSNSLSNREIVLQGDHYISHTLTASNVSGLTIRGGNETTSTIYCKPPTNSSDIGSGLIFVSVTDLTVHSVTFKGCGTLQYSTTFRDGEYSKYRSAVYIFNSTNIHFDESSFHKNVGRALSLHDVDGHVIIENSEFLENSVPYEEQVNLFGGGGIYIEFTYCALGYQNCSYTQNRYNRNSVYVIKDCVFKANRATSNDVTAQIHTVQFRILAGNDGNYAGEGAGIAVFFKGSSFNNSIAVLNCSFYNNSAQFGGGINVLFQDYSHYNTLYIGGCVFANNTATERSGGVMSGGYIALVDHVAYNNITYEDTLFVNNSAGWGGAISFVSSRSKIEVDNVMHFINCTWRGNSASFGAALSLRPAARNSIFDGKVPTPLLHNCSFFDNRVVDTAAFLTSANDGVSQQVLESGALHMDAFTVDFLEFVIFTGNKGSAIFASSSQINVLENTTVQFTRNRATNGGAIALHGFSILELFSKSQVFFDSNSASLLGGAVYATSPHQTVFIYSHSCFITHHSITDPDQWDTEIIFTKNTAKFGQAIYADSLLPCAKHKGDVITNVSAAFRWTGIVFTSGNVHNTIATSPSAISFTLPAEIAPGERININPMPIDDLNQTIPTAYQAFLDIDSGQAVTNSYISDDGHLQIKGQPGTKFTLRIQTQNTRHTSSSRTSRLGNCPMGFILDNDGVCVCTANTRDRRLVGVPECNTSSFKAVLQIGYWVGCIEGDEVATSYCPLGYCNYQFESESTGQSIEIPKSCGEENETKLCIEHRRGDLCGDCEEGYTVFYHSENFKCGRCSYGAFGLFIYLIAEIIPLVLLFAVVMVMKLKMTSGLMQSLLLFAQTITLINHTPSFLNTSQASQTLIRIHTIIIGFLSLDFFRLDDLSFCLWSGATVLQNLLFRYVTTLFAVLLLGILVLLNKYNLFEAIVKKICSESVKNWAGKNQYKNSIVHGITTFLMLSYTQYTVTSFQILSRLTLYGEGGRELRSVVHLQGSVDYFGADHLLYAIPAVLVLLCLSLPPPLLLISYPLLWKVKAKMKRVLKISENENETTIWLIRKLLPLIDSFQGVFKDSYRMFAGLLFLWRVILTAIFALSTNFTEFFLLTEVALLCFIAIHSLTRPYKRQLYNTIDIVILTDMLLINLLSWYTISISFDSRASRDIEIAVAIKIILMYLPLVAMAVIAIPWLLRRYGLMPKWARFLNLSKTGKSSGTSSKKKTLRDDSCADKDLFERATEPNSSSLVLSSGGAGFELQTDETLVEEGTNTSAGYTDTT